MKSYDIEANYETSEDTTARDNFPSIKDSQSSDGKENLLFEKIENLLKSYHLSTMAMKLAMQWLKMSFSESEEDDVVNKVKSFTSTKEGDDKGRREHSLYHVQKWILSRIGGKSHLLALKESISPYQYYCPELIPGFKLVAVR